MRKQEQAELVMERLNEQPPKRPYPWIIPIPSPC